MQLSTSCFAVATASLLLGLPVHGQRAGGSQNDTLGVAHGFLSLTTRHFAAELVKDAQVLVSLKRAGGSPPSSFSSFDFLPRDRLSSRARNGQHHWGDVNLRYRLEPETVASSPWIDVTSSSARKPVTSLPVDKQSSPSSSNITILASADLGPTLSSSASSTPLPFTINREWLDVDGDLGLRFRITYQPPLPSSPSGNVPALEIGGLGFPTTVNNIFTGRSPEDVQALCSLADPYTGMDAGYLRVAPVGGMANVSVLLVTPLRGTRTPLEAYRNLDEPNGADDPVNAYETQSFEGFYEWQTVTASWADNDWRSTQVRGVVGSTNGAPWNGHGRGPMILRRPGDTVVFGLRFSLTGISGGTSSNVGPAAVDATLRRPNLDMPVVRGVPGYVLSRSLPGQLFVWPPRDTVNVTVAVDPPDALSLALATTDDDHNATTPLEYQVTPSATAWGRVRVDLTYHRFNISYSSLQTVHYYVTKPAAAAVANLGRFLTTKQLFTDTTDPFGRGNAPTILSYDAELGDVVRQEPRVWIAGLSDEAGAGSFLAAAAKQAVLPSAAELAVLVPFVDRVLWGAVQNGNTSNNDPYGVKKSVFFHDPAVLPRYAYNRSLDWSSWTSWKRTQAYATDRAYDYVHVAATYWAMYRAARAYPEVFANITQKYQYTAFVPSAQNSPWTWYLRQAAETVQRAMATPAAGAYKAQHANDGLMGETVIGSLLIDLQREADEHDNNTQKEWIRSAATTIESLMRTRARRWAATAVPFDSEMAWDSTAQEGVHLWATRFGDAPTAQKAVDTVLGFTPAVPHWAWNGNARRYWDNVYGGKLARIERQVHHYGSALNGLVLLEAATVADGASDDIAYLLRTGYAGASAPLTNIAADGFASASFHSWPDALAWDAYSGDYGPGFLGMVLGSGTYVVQDTELLSTGRLLCYGGVLSRTNTTTTVHPRDAWQRRVFLGPLGLLITVDAGIIESVSFSASLSDGLSLTLGQREDASQAAAAIVWLEATSKTATGVNFTVILEQQPTTSLVRTRGGWQVPLEGTTSAIIHVTAS